MTANSGTFFHPKQSTSTKNHNNYSKQTNANQRSSANYGSSDSSSEEMLKADLRRGSAPITHDQMGVEQGAYLQTTGQRNKKKMQTQSNAYVFTSDDSFSDNDGDDDSDDSDDNSADFNARADVYQPASHLRKAVATSNTAK